MSSCFHFSLVIRDTGDSRHVITKGHVINRNPRYDRYFKPFFRCKMKSHNVSPLSSSDEIDVFDINRWILIKIDL